jgi:Electron transfer DM13
MKIVRALLLAVAAAAATAAGVYVAGGVISNDFETSMALTAAWFGTAAAIALASLKAGRSTGLPILIGYAIAATAIGAYLAATTLRDKTVNEIVVVADPVSAAQADAPSRKPRNVLEARGQFTSAEHTTRGTARVIRLPSGRRVLTLTGFETDAGPDLRVRIGDVDLGALKGNKGDQQYDIPEGFKPRNHTVLIWCRAFSALFGSAQLRAA